jgi:two-component system, OmpR family, phosphate regulon response regulator OmpR
LASFVGKRVLLIEDDSRLAGMLSEYLGKAAFNVIHAENGARGLVLHEREAVHVVILDLMLPDTDGLEICRQIRAQSSTPILMLTARGDPVDRVVGLEMGADDYLPKPFEPRELLARLRAILRRSSAPAAAASSDVLRYGRLEIDRGRSRVRREPIRSALVCKTRC